ncbi:MAG: ECF transporter S component, partial [Candidatus Odinarchaeota archaeon]
MIRKNNFTYNITLIALIAALYVVISILPGIPVAPGVEIQFEAGFAVVIGVLLGPYIGFLTAL